MARGLREPEKALAAALSALLAALAAPCCLAQVAGAPLALPQKSPAAPGVAAGTLSGVAGSQNGALVEGVRVSLQAADGTSLQSTVSDADGRFSFRGVPPGPFRLLLTLDGFDPLLVTGSLLPGQRLAVPVPPLALATYAVSVDAVLPPDVIATEQMYAEEHQRLLGVLPNFFVSYNWTAPPLTTKQKFTLATRNALDPGNLFLVGTVAGVQQATNAFPGYHQGAAGYGKRYGADLANLVVGTYMGGAVLPTLFHQDPRYFYKGTGTKRSRFLYAISTAVICRGDNGHRQPAFASVLGDLSAGAVSNLYYASSDRQGAVLTLENGLLGIAGDAMNNVFQEFVLKKVTVRK